MNAESTSYKLGKVWQGLTKIRPLNMSHKHNVMYIMSYVQHSVTTITYQGQLRLEHRCNRREMGTQILSIPKIHNSSHIIQGYTHTHTHTQIALTQ